MSVKLVKWGSKVKFSRGPDKEKEYSPGGEKGEEVEVPQIDESLGGIEFWTAHVNQVGSEDEAKKIVNRMVYAYPAIREGQQKFKASHKKSGVQNLNDAIKESLLAIKEYVPTLTKERGAVVTEAFQKASKMDQLQAARLKVARGEMDIEKFYAMLDDAFIVETEEVSS